MTRQFEQYSAYTPMPTITAADTMTDTREKLEADVRQYVLDAWAQGWEAGQHDDMDCRNFYIDEMRALLDRQAAITERHWMEIVGASANANVELKRQIDELNAALQSERENELTKALNEVAEKWAIAQVESEDCTKRCMMLEELVRDMWNELITCPDYVTPPCMTNNICERVRKVL